MARVLIHPGPRWNRPVALGLSGSLCARPAAEKAKRAVKAIASRRIGIFTFSTLRRGSFPEEPARISQRRRRRFTGRSLYTWNEHHLEIVSHWKLFAKSPLHLRAPSSENPRCGYRDCSVVPGARIAGWVPVQHLLFSLALLLLCISAVRGIPRLADSDHDGLSDQLEQSLLTQFAPKFSIGVQDCAGLPAEFTPGLREPAPAAEDGTIYGQVSPVKVAEDRSRWPKSTSIDLWDRDCGAHGHPLDTEHVAVLVEASGTISLPRPGRPFTGTPPRMRTLSATSARSLALQRSMPKIMALRSGYPPVSTHPFLRGVV